LEVAEGGHTLTAAFEGAKQRAGIVSGLLRNGERLIQVELAVVDLHGDELLIGSDLFEALGYSILGVPCAWPGQVAAEEPDIEATERMELRLRASGEVGAAEKERVMNAWADLIAINQGIPENACVDHPSMVLRLDTGQAMPVFVSQYPLASKWHEQITARVSEWLAKGWIRKTKSDNPWSFPLMAVAKKGENGTKSEMRLCIDLRELNKLLQNVAYPLPRIQSLMMGLHGSQYFGTFDQADSYHQWPIAAEHIGKIAFVWNGVHYEFVRACFGVKTMTTLFQRAMADVFAGIEGLELYIDDALLHAEDLEAYIAFGKAFLERCNEVNIRLRLAKCVLVAAELRNLGRMVGRRGFRPEPAKIQEILDWKRPESRKALKSFNCLAGYYREHIRGFATIIDPLVKQQEGTAALEWTKEMEEAFEAIKKEFAGDLVLAFPDFSQVMELYVDASLVGMGAALMQGPEGAKRLIVATSRAFRGSEMHYSATKKELKALVWALGKLEQILLGGKFIVYTDHRALTFLLSQRHQAAMLERWTDKLLRFDMQISHVPGAENVVADALSRQYEKWLVDRHGKPAPDAVGDVAELLYSDHAKVVNRVEDEQQAAERKASMLGLELVVAKEERARILDDAHLVGHVGTDKLVEAVMENGKWWPTLRSEAADLVSRCDPCLKFNVARRGYHELKGSVDAAEPWQLILLDLAQLPKAASGEEYLLVVADAFTRFVILRPLAKKTSEAVATQLWRFSCVRLFADFGVPLAIQSDQGAEFVNQVVQSLRRLFGVQHRLVAAYNHAANGLVERSIRTVTAMLKKHMQGASQGWPKWVPLVQMAANMTVNATTGTAPFLLMFGRTWKQFGDNSEANIPVDTEESRKQFEEKLRWFVDRLYPAIMERNAKKKKRSKAYRRKMEHKAAKISSGMKVYALDPIRKSKWDTLYDGPFEVVGVDDKRCYVLKDQDGKLLGRHVPIDQLKVVNLESVPEAFEVEKVIDHQETDDGVAYLVKWKNLPDTENSWEPVEHFNDWTVIQKYWKGKTGSTKLKRGVLTV
jgi:transposase InsO family protein